MTPETLDITEAERLLARAKDYADSPCIDDRMAACEALRDLEIWAEATNRWLHDTTMEVAV